MSEKPYPGGAQSAVVPLGDVKLNGRVVTKPEENFALTYAPGALEALLDATACHPAVIQAVAHQLIENLDKKGSTKATIADIELAIEQAPHHHPGTFDNIWLDAKPEGQAILLARVRGEEIPHFPAAERWLVGREVLTDEGKFVVPVVERWVLREKASVLDA